MTPSNTPADTYISVHLAFGPVLMLILCLYGDIFTAVAGVIIIHSCECDWWTYICVSLACFWIGLDYASAPFKAKKAVPTTISIFYTWLVRLSLVAIATILIYLQYFKARNALRQTTTNVNIVMPNNDTFDKLKRKYQAHGHDNRGLRTEIPPPGETAPLLKRSMVQRPTVQVPYNYETPRRPNWNEDNRAFRLKYAAKNDQIAETSGWARGIISFGSFGVLLLSLFMGATHALQMSQLWNSLSEHVLNLPSLVRIVVKWLDGVEGVDSASLASEKAQLLQAADTIGRLKTLDDLTKSTKKNKVASGLLEPDIPIGAKVPKLLTKSDCELKTESRRTTPKGDERVEASTLLPDQDPENQILDDVKIDPAIQTIVDKIQTTGLKVSPQKKAKDSIKFVAASTVIRDETTETETDYDDVIDMEPVMPNDTALIQLAATVSKRIADESLPTNFGDDEQSLQDTQNAINPAKVLAKYGPVDQFHDFVSLPLEAMLAAGPHNCKSVGHPIIYKQFVPGNPGTIEIDWDDLLTYCFNKPSYIEMWRIMMCPVCLTKCVIKHNGKELTTELDKLNLAFGLIKANFMTTENGLNVWKDLKLAYCESKSVCTSMMAYFRILGVGVTNYDKVMRDPASTPGLTVGVPYPNAAFQMALVDIRHRLFECINGPTDCPCTNYKYVLLNGEVKKIELGTAGTPYSLYVGTKQQAQEAVARYVYQSPLTLAVNKWKKYGRKAQLTTGQEKALREFVESFQYIYDDDNEVRRAILIYDSNSRYYEDVTGPRKPQGVMDVLRWRGAIAKSQMLTNWIPAFIAVMWLTPMTFRWLQAKVWYCIAWHQDNRPSANNESGPMFFFMKPNSDWYWRKHINKMVLIALLVAFMIVVFYYYYKYFSDMKRMAIKSYQNPAVKDEFYKKYCYYPDDAYCKAVMMTDGTDSIEFESYDYEAKGKNKGHGRGARRTNVVLPKAAKVRRTGPKNTHQPAAVYDQYAAYLKDYAASGGLLSDALDLSDFIRAYGAEMGCRWDSSTDEERYSEGEEEYIENEQDQEDNDWEEDYYSDDEKAMEGRPIQDLLKSIRKPTKKKEEAPIQKSKRKPPSKRIVSAPSVVAPAPISKKTVSTIPAGSALDLQKTAARFGVGKEERALLLQLLKCHATRAQVEAVLISPAAKLFLAHYYDRQAQNAAYHITPKVAMYSRVYRLLVNGKYVSNATLVNGGFLTTTHGIVPFHADGYATTRAVLAKENFEIDVQLIGPKGELLTKMLHMNEPHDFYILDSNPELTYIPFIGLPSFPRSSIATIDGKEPGYLVTTITNGNCPLVTSVNGTVWVDSMANSGEMCTDITTAEGYCGSPYFTASGMVGIHYAGGTSQRINYGIALDGCADELQRLCPNRNFH